MTQKIKVTGEHGERVGETFPRRARQLVRSGRAEWAGDGISIRLHEGLAAENDPQTFAESPRSKEDSEMVYGAVSNGERADGEGYVVVDADKSAARRAGAAAFSGDADLDAAAMRLARRKLAARRRVNRYALGVAAVVCSFWLIREVGGNSYNPYFVAELAAIYTTGAICSIVMRYVVYFVRHGIRRTSRRYADSPLMREYEKLRRLPPADLREEARRLGGDAGEFEL